MPLLQVQHISKQFKNGLFINDINFEQQVLQKIAIAGESGAGKTTLLKIISGHAQPDSGTVLFNGERVIGPKEKLLPGHKQIAYLSQHYELLNNYRVEELIWFENTLKTQAANELFEICRISELLKRRTDALSGGEKQRISLCMLLVKSPTMLLLDEPFSNLDLIHTNILKDVLEEITERLKITCLLTSHDPHDTLSWADEILVMKSGRIIQNGTPQYIYHKPVNEYVAGLFGTYNMLKPSIAALFNIQSNGNDILMRPEHFTFNEDGKGIKGIIQKIHFYGSYSEVAVSVNDATLLVRTTTNKHNVGQEVFINIVE